MSLCPDLNIGQLCLGLLNLVICFEYLHWHVSVKNGTFNILLPIKSNFNEQINEHYSAKNLAHYERKFITSSLLPTALLQFLS